LALAIALDVGGMCGNGMCQKRGATEENFFKNAKGRPLLFSFVQRYYFFKVQVVTEPFTCPRGESLLVGRQPFYLKTNLSGPYGWQQRIKSNLIQ